MATHGLAIDVPIRQDDEGTLRIAGTRVTLDMVIARFQQGATPEQINDSFPLLKREDLYAVISYYLRNQNEIDAYLRQQDEEAARLRRELEAKLRKRTSQRDS